MVKSVKKEIKKKKTAKVSTKKVSAEQKRVEYLMKPTKLIKERMNKDISQVAVATELGMSRIHYGNIEKGLYNPKEDVVQSIAKYFKTSVETLFKKFDKTHYVVKKA